MPAMRSTQRIKSLLDKKSFSVLSGTRAVLLPINLLRSTSRLWTPRTILFMPHFKQESILLWEKSSGFISRVISAPFDNSKRFLTAEIIFSRCSSFKREGVPPPKYIVSAKDGKTSLHDEISSQSLETYCSRITSSLSGTE
ncbi:MAG: hypothetical protein BWY23_02737 [Spirochaetes bacterium ADurb.Bin218]|nr:MAG: hypothetical protein BWY23_02737 [Spirochaetes bacterium ADurb.Bin218]